VNSSCEAVSQALLLLEDALPISPHNMLSSPAHSAVHCDDDSQSTVDAAGVLHISAAVNDCDTQVTGVTKMTGNNDGDETQYVEHCYEGVPIRHVDSIALSLDSSPSLLDATKILRFISSDDAMVQTTAADETVLTDTQLQDVSIEPQEQTTEAVCQSMSVPTVSSITDCTDDDRQVQLCGSNDVCFTASLYSENMAVADDANSPSATPVTSAMRSTALPSCGSLQVDCILFV